MDRVYPPGIQIGSDSFTGERPCCPQQCPGRVHRHGRYQRYAKSSGSESVWIQRFRCPYCGLTISVRPAERLPYVTLTVPRLEAFLDSQAGIGSGPDPPPDLLEAGCLHRAWARFQTRGHLLQDAFGLLLPSVISGAANLWLEMRRAKESLQGILQFLAQTCKRSLLGDYRCLRAPA